MPLQQLQVYAHCECKAWSTDLDEMRRIGGEVYVATSQFQVQTAIIHHFTHTTK